MARLNSAPQEILEPHYERESHPAIPRLVHYIHQVNRLAVRLCRHHLNIPSSINSKVPAAPSIDIIERDSGRNIPSVSHFDAKLSDKVSNSIGSCKNSDAIRRLRSPSLFLIRFFGLRTFLFHFPKNFAHILDFLPYLTTDVDRSGLLRRHCDTVTGSRINFDDLFLLQLILRAQDESRKIGPALQIIDNHAFDLGTERPQNGRKQIVRQRPLLLCTPHEHGNCRPDALIHVDHKDLLLVANKNRAATARGNHSANLHFDNGFTHVASLASRLIASRSELSLCTGSPRRLIRRRSTIPGFSSREDLKDTPSFLHRIDNPLLDLRVKVNLLQDQIATRKPFRRGVHRKLLGAE